MPVTLAVTRDGGTVAEMEKWNARARQIVDRLRDVPGLEAATT